jgi:molybdopterin synthase sulfur carrier subunit
VDALSPGFLDYVLDERGALRRHVSVFIGEDMVIDRDRLSDRVADGGTVFVFQALSGG